MKLFEKNKRLKVLNKKAKKKAENEKDAKKM